MSKINDVAREADAEAGGEKAEEDRKAADSRKKAAEEQKHLAAVADNSVLLQAFLCAAVAPLAQVSGEVLLLLARRLRLPIGTRSATGNTWPLSCSTPHTVESDQDKLLEADATGTAPAVDWGRLC